MSSKYTPGPWAVDESGLNVVCSDGSGLLGSRDTDEKRANARLVAAAPNMLEMMKNLRASLEFQKLSRRQIITILTEEINRAEGKATA